MLQALLPRIAACVLTIGFSSASGVPLSDPPGSAATERVLGWIETNRSQRTPADLAAARQLNAQGDRAYKRKHYDSAFTAYSNSYPNFPNAHAYIMSGDAHWRGVVKYHEVQARQQDGGPQSCTLDNTHFAHDLALDVAQHHDVGVTLAMREHDQRFMQSALYRRARESAACLHDLAALYETQPPTACIDLSKLRACLGKPLIR